jgi:hypothetical protein
LVILPPGPTFCKIEEALADWIDWEAWIECSSELEGIHVASASDSVTVCALK